MLDNCFGTMLECGGPSDTNSLPRKDCSDPFGPVAASFWADGPFFLPRQDSIAYERPVVTKQRQTTTGKAGSWANQIPPHEPLLYRVLVWKVIPDRGASSSDEGFSRYVMAQQVENEFRVSGNLLAGNHFRSAFLRPGRKRNFSLVCVTIKSPPLVF